MFCVVEKHLMPSYAIEIPIGILYQEKLFESSWVFFVWLLLFLWKKNTTLRMVEIHICLG